jgi:hypothetical protein
LLSEGIMLYEGESDYMAVLKRGQARRELISRMGKAECCIACGLSMACMAAGEEMLRGLRKCSCGKLFVMSGSVGVDSGDFRNLVDYSQVRGIEWGRWWEIFWGDKKAVNGVVLDTVDRRVRCFVVADCPVRELAGPVRNVGLLCNECFEEWRNE